MRNKTLLLLLVVYVAGQCETLGAVTGIREFPKVDKSMDGSKTSIENDEFSLAKKLETHWRSGKSLPESKSNSTTSSDQDQLAQPKNSTTRQPQPNENKPKSTRQKRTFWPFTSLFGYDYYPPPIYGPGMLGPLGPPLPPFGPLGMGMPVLPSMPPLVGLGFSLGLF